MMEFVRSRKFAVCVALACTLLCTAVRPAEPSKEDQIRQYFQKSVDCYQAGDYKGCAEALKKVLELKPTSALALELRDRAGYAYFAGLLMKKPLDQLAREFLQIAEREVIVRNRDPEYIKKLIKDLSSDDFETRWMAKLHIEAEVGQFAVPYLVALVKDKKEDVANFSRIVLRGIGEEGVPAITAAFASRDNDLIALLSVVLGQIKDDRALPYLLAVWQNTKTPGYVKEATAKAIKEISGSEPASFPSAAEMFFRLAEKYYYRHPAILRESRAVGYVLWRWSDETNGLVWQECPPSVYYLERAEEMCYRGMEVDPDHQPLYPLLASVYFAEMATAEVVLKAAAMPENEFVDIVTRNKDYLEWRLGDLKRKFHLVTAAMGPVYLYRCLDRALRDRNFDVADMAMDALAVVADGSLLPPEYVSTEEQKKKTLPRKEGTSLTDERKAEKAAPSPRKRTVAREDGEKVKAVLPPEGLVAGAEGTPLVRALADPEKRVRYSAASTLVAIDPARRFLYCERVVPVLCQALGERAIWKLLIVDTDLQRVNKLKGLFPKGEFDVVFSSTYVDARSQAKDFPAPDFILIANNLPNEEASLLVDKLIEDFRTVNIPRYILTTKERHLKDEDEFKGRVTGFIVLHPDLRVSVEIMRREFKKMWAGSVKVEAEKVAKRAAESLAAINPRDTVFTPQDALNILLKSIVTRIDEIRKPCLVALRKLHRKEATDVLVSVFQNKKNKDDIRVLAAKAIATSDPLAAYDALRQGLNDPSAAVRAAAAEALGHAPLSGAQLRALLEDQRIGPPAGTRPWERLREIAPKAAEVTIPDKPDEVVKLYMKAVTGNDVQTFVALLGKEKREELETLKKSDVDEYKQQLVMIILNQSPAFTGARIKDSRVEENSAVVLATKPGYEIVFRLSKAEGKWHIVSILIRRGLAG